MSEQTSQAQQEQQIQEPPEFTLPQLRGAILSLSPLEFADLWAWLTHLAAQRFRRSLLRQDNTPLPSLAGSCADLVDIVVDDEGVSAELDDDLVGAFD